MPTQCILTLRGPIEIQQLERDLLEIIHKRFADLLRLEFHKIENEICDWDLIFDDFHKFHICLKQDNLLQFTHPDDAWSMWAQCVVEDELYSKYHPQFFDEEFPKETSPFLQQHENFITYLDSNLIHHSSDWKKYIIKVELSHLPEKLRKL